MSGGMKTESAHSAPPAAPSSHEHGLPRAHLPLQEVREGQADRVPISAEFHQLQNPDVLQLSRHVGVVEGIGPLGAVGLDAVDEMRGTCQESPQDVLQRFLQRQAESS